MSGTTAAEPRGPTGPVVLYDRAMARLVVVCLALAVGGCARQAAAPFAPWELRGTVVEASGDRLRVRHKSGQIVDLLLDDRTAITGAEGAATVSALTHGRRVIVSVEPQADGHPRAVRIRLFAKA